MQSSKFLGAASALVLAFGFASNNAHAAGAPAGTQINNTASVSYTVGTVNTTANSNLVTVTVVEILDVNVDAQTRRSSVSPGDTAQVAEYIVAEHRQRSRDLPPGAGQRDHRPTTSIPIAASPAIYIDSTAGGTLASSTAAISPTCPAAMIRRWRPTRPSPSSW